MGPRESANTYLYHIYTYRCIPMIRIPECLPASNPPVQCRPFWVAGSCISAYYPFCRKLACGVSGHPWTTNDCHGTANYTSQRNCWFLLKLAMLIYRSWSCRYFEVGVAGISESEWPVYRSPSDIPEHPNMPNLGTPGTHYKKPVINQVLLP